MPKSGTAYIECILVNPTLLRQGATLEEAIAVTCSLQLEGMTPAQILKLRGDERAKVIDFHTEAIVTSRDPNVEPPRRPLQLKGTIPCYYCSFCGTPLKSGRCKGCRRIVPNRSEFHGNEATTLPARAYWHLTHNNRFVFSKKPKIVESDRPQKPLSW